MEQYNSDCQEMFNLKSPSAKDAGGGHVWHHGESSDLIWAFTIDWVWFEGTEGKGQGKQESNMIKAMACSEVGCLSSYKGFDCAETAPEGLRLSWSWFYRGPGELEYSSFILVFTTDFFHMKIN